MKISESHRIDMVLLESEQFVDCDEYAEVRQEARIDAISVTLKRGHPHSPYSICLAGKKINGAGKVINRNYYRWVELDDLPEGIRQDLLKYLMGNK